MTIRKILDDERLIEMRDEWFGKLSDLFHGRYTGKVGGRMSDRHRRK